MFFIPKKKKKIKNIVYTIIIYCKQIGPIINDYDIVVKVVNN